LTYGAVLIFARRPELGKVKTRLESRLGKQLTLAVYRAFLADTLEAARQGNATVILAHTPGPRFPEQDLADLVIEQRGITFGERFDSAFEDSANLLRKQTPIVLIGADTPHLSPDSLRDAIDTLGGCGAVIGQNFTNGFYLLGFASYPVPVSEVFSYPSIEETVALQRLLHTAGIVTRYLTLQFDIDTLKDLVRLVHLIGASKGQVGKWIPKNTRDVLVDSGIIQLAA